MAGLEPTISEAKSGVLPLHYIPMVSAKEAGTAGLFLMWGGIWGSNPRHPEPQSGALPTELIPPKYDLYLVLPFQQNQSEGFDFEKDEQRSERAFELARKRDDAQLARTLARQEGFEPPTYCLEGSCSILLSYWRVSMRTGRSAIPSDAGAGDGNRTHVSSLEGWCSTIELHPQGLFSLEIIP